MLVPRKSALAVLVLAFACTGKSSTQNAAPADDAPPAKAAAPAKEREAAAAPADPKLLDPFAASEQAPDEFKVKFETTEGDFVVAVHRDWAPNGADRFYNLVKLGFYRDVAFFRAIEGFMVQFGIHGDPEVAKAWKMAPIKDDPQKQSNKKGYVTYAKSGPNTRSTQLFINYRDNAPLDPQGFPPFGEVVEGMDVVEKLHTGYGEGAPRGSGPDQRMIEREGNAYLRKRFPELDYIERATLVDG